MIDEVKKIDEVRRTIPRINVFRKSYLVNRTSYFFNLPMLFTSLIKLSRLASVAAHFHVAPAAAMAFALIEEQPCASRRGAFAHELQIIRREQIRCFPCKREPQNLELPLVVDPLPSKTILLRDQGAVVSRLLYELVELG